MGGLLIVNHFFSAADASRLCVELFRGLVCKSYVHDTMRFSLPPKVDLGWHGAILNTKLYRELCDRLFNRFLDHTTATVQDSVDEKNTRVDLTLQMYLTVFGENPPADLWEREEQEAESKAKKLKTETGFETQDLTIFVKMDGLTSMMQLSPDMLISGLKSLLSVTLFHAPYEDQRLIYARRNLSDEQTIKSAGISNESTLYLVLQQRGC